MPNGKVLVAGGAYYDVNLNAYVPVASTEIYDPCVRHTWTAGAPMNLPRWTHSAIVLSNGKVMIFGGQSYSAWIQSTETYDPATGLWSPTNSEPYDLGGQLDGYANNAIMLPNGKILIDGYAVYDPGAGTWTNIPASGIPNGMTVNYLPGGKLLVTGGSLGSYLAGIFDFASGTWSSLGSQPAELFVYGSGALLPSGKVFMVGATDRAAYLFDPGLGYSNSWQPQITSINSPLTLGGSLAVNGENFRGYSEASGGNGVQDSSSDYPLVQLRTLANDHSVFLTITNWSSNSLATLPVTNFPIVFAMATVFVNGIQSQSSIVFINPALSAIVLTKPANSTTGFFPACSPISPAMVFGFLASTNLATPATNWAALGGATETSAGHYQFTDSQATNYPARYYRVRWP